MFNTILILLILSISLSVVWTYNLNVAAARVFSDPHPHAQHRGSYFGYAVALYNDPNRSDPIVLVGAPRANSSSRATSAREPGVVFICTLNEDCKEWFLSSTTLQLSHGTSLRDYSWFGASINVDSEDQPRVVVCAPRWRFKYDKNWYMNGMCHYAVLKSAESLKNPQDLPIMPLTVFDEQVRIIGGHSYYWYGMGLLGFSLHTYYDDPTWGIIMGSPGLYSVGGGIVLGRENQFGALQTGIPTIYSSRLGYSVTSGKYFDNQRYFVMSAPFENSKKGKVTFFQLNHADYIDKEKYREGLQHGEYFGSSTTSCDINGDGKDELIVGAPLWTNKADEGRVYIFNSNGKTKYATTLSWIDGQVEDARFGTAVACLGDMDRDGYMDIAVGAPYENNHGAIYIFNGRSDGLAKIPSQRIGGENFSHFLRGFGISISAARDIDGNGYPDIAVGAYMTGHAVLLRAQPVVVVHINIIAQDRTKLQSDSESISFQVCSSYNGKDVPRSLRILRILDVDIGQGRASIANLKSNNGTYHLRGTLRVAEILCETITIILAKNIQNVIDPIDVSASLILDRPMTSDPKIFCSTCPVIDKIRSTMKDTQKLPFALDCGTDNICYTNLTLMAATNLKNNKFIVGTKSMVKLFVNVSNTGEAAYQAQTHLLIPQSVALSSVLPNCVEKNEIQGILEVICNIGNPFRSEDNATFELDMSRVKSNDEHVQIVMYVTTQSENINKRGSQANLTIIFDVDVDITVIGKAEKDLYNYFNKKEDQQLEKISFQHIYEVRKFGATPIEQSLLVVFIPTHIIDKSTKRKIEIARINKTDLSEMIFSGRSADNFDEETGLIAEKFDYIHDNSVDRGNMTQINCTNPLIVCTRISYTLDTPLDSSTIGEVTITIDLLLNNFTDSLTNGENIIYYASYGHVEVTDPAGIVQKPGNKPDYYIVGTTFVSSQAAGVAIWIIAVSAIFGILLLALLTLALIKLGFFSRKKREELEALKANEDNKHGIVIETTSSREALDQD